MPGPENVLPRTRTYLQLVGSERVGDKVRQRVVATLGRLDTLEAGPLDKLIDQLTRFSRKQWVLEQARQIRARQAKTWGPVLIFRQLWEQLGLAAMLGRLVEKAEGRTDFEEAAFAMVLNRLLDPMSKLRVSEWVKTIYRPEWERLELDHFYRALDFLSEHKTELEQGLYDQVRNLFNLELDLVLWDATTTYFEGRAAEGLAEYGFSKDKRPDRVQIMVGVLVSRDGFPIAHEVFPGNTAEVDTFRHVIGMVKQEFHPRRVILVADRGMVSGELLRELEGSNLEYIVGVRMRKLKAAREVLSRAGRYREVSLNLKVKEVVHAGVRYLVCLNPEERERDRLPVDGRAPEEESRYDGKWVLRTNSSLAADEVAQAYKNLWQVEHAFRELKSRLDLRPIYHWRERRIRGHVVVCFLALVLETALRRKLKALGKEVRYDDLLLDLCQLQAVDLHLDGKRYLARTELAGCADVAFRAVGLRPPLHVTEVPL